MRVWRICRKRHAAAAFSGEGTRLFAGRWNPVGVPLVYTSLSLSLAALEVFVNLDPDEEPGDLASLSAELPIDETAVERIDLAELPPDWQLLNHPALQMIGAEWIASGRSLALLIPSAVIDGEWNALINPTHPAASTIKIAAPKPFRFDPRMFK
jgi:RES domain-containing protein